jgi:2-methylcitrate dehydratase PrpD
MVSVIERIAQRAEMPPPVSPLATARARDAVIDTIGCIFAGAHDGATRSVAKAFASECSRTGPSWIAGYGRASPAVAALVNGTAAHSLDFDDNFHPARAHASAVLIPALLAIATVDEAISGRQFIDAYLVGLDAQAAVGFGVNPSHYNAGWHGTSTVGCIGAAAGVARLLNLARRDIAQAMSIATSFAAGPKGQFGTPVKPLHAGMAARHAVEAGLLARAGMAGRLDILEGSQGFLELFGGDAPSGWHGLEWGDRHVIEMRGLVTKRQPGCASTHRAIDAVLELAEEVCFSEDDIASIDTLVGLSAARNLAYPDPQDEMQARFSMQYCVAAALVQGKLSLADFTPDAIHRPAIRRLMPRIVMKAYAAAQERGVERLPHRVTVTLADGRCFTRERLHAKGAIAAPLSEADRRAKFEDCLAWAGVVNVGQIYDHLLALDQAPSVRQLVENIQHHLGGLS